MNDKKIELTLGLVNAVMQYLGTRPYQEVYHLILAVQDEAKGQVTPPQEEPEAVSEE
jgi:hypothetical protein